jgi:hypothetical protein
MTESTTPAAEDLPRCANCKAPLHGPYCYACGQPVKGLIRHLSGIVGDFLDSVLNFDSRTLRTIGPLMFRPGYLTTEYFAGRRVRFVTPLRLFFFLSVIAFFTVQISLEQSGLAGQAIFQTGDDDKDDVDTAMTVAQVEERVALQLKSLEESKKKLPPGVKAGLDKAAIEIRKEADERIAYLKAAEEARAKNLPPPPDPAMSDRDDLSFNGTPWDPKTNPLKVDWLPAYGNTKLNELASNMKENIGLARKEPKRLVIRFFGVLPQTLFVLMPLFAVLLKFFYLFKRRLYMEHLIVALHSHAFISFALLMIALFAILRMSVPALNEPLKYVMVVIAWWIPLYLLIMQKRVYRQGWIMTFLKYGMIGICYTVLVALAASAALIVSLASK